MLRQSALLDPSSRVSTSLRPDQTLRFSVLSTPRAPLAASWIGICVASSMTVCRLTAMSFSVMITSELSSSTSNQ